MTSAGRRNVPGLGTIGISSLIILLSACSSAPPPPLSDGHLKPEPTPAKGSIPAPVQWSSALPEPEPQVEDETYTIVVSDIPVNELLFALAHEAKLNIDIHPDIEGSVTINVINQTLHQILDRLSSQVSLRYTINGPNLIISPDTPYFDNYKIDYANISRDTNHSISLSTQIASTGTSIDGESTQGNNSATEVSSVSFNHFWGSLVKAVIAILGDEDGLSAATDAGRDELPITHNVIPNPETGILTVRATQAQHIQIRNLVDRVQESSDRQVLIEATLVEISLSQEFRAGVDWQRLQTSNGGGLEFQQNLIGDNFAGLPSFILSYQNATSVLGDIMTTIELLEQFGDATILSSPKVMVLNNQNALLKVVDNVVYFTIEIEDERNTDGFLTSRTVESDIHTVPVGFVMTVTPQISDSGKITMNVRPTISRILEFVEDPAVSIASATAIASTPPGGTPPEPVVSEIPVVQVREFESMLRVNSGQTAVLGGLMQDTTDKSSDGLPGASNFGDFGNLFKYRQNEFNKTELVIFLRPTIINNPTIEDELSNFKHYLTFNAFPDKNVVETTSSNTSGDSN